jgi:hypothetical protein
MGQSGELQGCRILVVEDYFLVAQGLCGMLEEEAGATIVCACRPRRSRAATGASALLNTKRHAPAKRRKLRGCSPVGISSHLKA